MPTPSERQEPQTTSRVLFYVVAGGLGLAFTLTLVLYAWQNAIDAAERAFTFESAAVVNTMSQNVRASDDVIHNVTSVFQAMGTVSTGAFQRYAGSVIAQHDFIDSVSYHDLIATKSGEVGQSGPDKRLPLRHQAIAFGRTGLIDGFDLMQQQEYGNSLRNAFDSGSAVPTPPLSDNAGASRFLLLQPVRSDPDADIVGFVAVKVDPARLVANVARPGLAISLLSVAPGVSGRETLFETPSSSVAGGGWLVQAFSEDASVQFPHYSMKIRVEKSANFGDIDQGLIFTALVLGLGTTLLLLALAHAKDVQSKELKDRNVEIERQVQRQTKELAEARDQAIEASRVKSDFLASMSHEIRTPLNAIIGMAELLAETPLSGEQDKYVNVFRRAGEALLALVNDILDVSKIEAGQLTLELIDFDVRELVEDAAGIYALKCDEKGVELVVHVANDVPAQLNGDPSRLRQIILNLVGNAIKFTEQGEIIVRAMCQPDTNDPDSLRFSVADTGIGIPEGKRENIFSSFTQVDSSTTRKYGGTGLGLTICKRLAEMMSGKIWVESKEGEGSTFLFDARFDAVIPQTHALAPDLAGLNVLLIDDNATNGRYIGEALGSHGATVTATDRGSAGIEAFEAAVATAPFNCVLVDCRMPELDGFQVVEKLKATGGDSRVVMMLPSSNLSENVTNSKSLGVDAYLVKPVKLAELLGAVTGEQTPKQDSVVPAAPTLGADKQAVSRQSILLVEDMVDNRLLIKAYLKKEPYDLDEAENGQIAVDKFKTGDYGLILMDLQMPVLDGHGATRAIREWEEKQSLKPTPIIALSAHAVREEMDKSLAAGCTAHLTKPIKKATLLAVCRT